MASELAFENDNRKFLDFPDKKKNKKKTFDFWRRF